MGISTQIGKYVNFLLFQTLADGLRTGETEWVEPIESTSAVDLTQTFLEGLIFIEYTVYLIVIDSDEDSRVCLFFFC